MLLYFHILYLLNRISYPLIAIYKLIHFFFYESIRYIIHTRPHKDYGWVQLPEEAVSTLCSSNLLLFIYLLSFLFSPLIKSHVFILAFVSNDVFVLIL
jgi:hypothetical protein